MLPSDKFDGNMKNHDEISRNHLLLNAADIQNPTMESTWRWVHPAVSFLLWHGQEK
jgi:hypothetical protein